MLDTVEKTLRDEVQHLADRPPTEAELSFAKRELAGTFALENETFAGQASSLGFYAAIDRWQFATTYLEGVQKVTLDQLNAAIKKYVSLPHSCTVIFKPKAPGPPARPRTDT